MREITGDLSFARSASYAIVCARFNAPITERLLEGCLAQFRKAGVATKHLTLVRVPGAFEIPTTAAALLHHNHYAAIVCLGAVVRGVTPHFDFVAGECARGIATLSRESIVPVIFGVITTDTWAQAEERAQPGLQNNKGADAAAAALEMVGLMSAIPPEDHADFEKRFKRAVRTGIPRKIRSAPRKK
ncbi:MAG TPA: 6,7-dimethyl-8-ribityllumazine synthase [Planctomycetota bacterium]|jgi:6,7-dimethyl-8-ribityllumazine synthase|nr:6,7-dimethyl-8-ribityllumazine synthase [Planctomycetota bacterium]